MCRAAAVAPAHPSSHRIVLDPIDMAVLASSDDFGGTTTPEVAALGRAASGDWLWLMSFDPKLEAGDEVESAFLLLEPADGTPPAAAPVPIEVAEVLGRWSSETTSWGRQPRLGFAQSLAPARPRPGAPLRVEVTAVVRGWAGGPPGARSLALLADGVDAHGASIATGLTRGVGPRLEVYLR